jgi:hypothetical protein
MGKKNKNKAPGTETGEKPRSSKWKATQQSAPLASAVSAMEEAKNPKAAAAESIPLSSCPPAEVATGTSSATNVV